VSVRLSVGLSVPSIDNHEAAATCSWFADRYYSAAGARAQ